MFDFCIHDDLRMRDTTYLNKRHDGQPHLKGEVRSIPIILMHTIKMGLVAINRKKRRVEDKYRRPSHT